MNERQLAKMKSLYDQIEGKKGNFGKIKNGLTKWRFIPYALDEDGDPKHFFRYNVHYMGRKAGYITCPSDFGEECPICKFRDKHGASEDERYAAFSSACYPSKKILVNALTVLEVEDESTGKVTYKTSRDPVELSVPKRVYDYIFTAMLKLGQTQVLDLEEGNIINIERNQLSPDPMHVEYNCIISPEPRPIFKGALREEVLGKAVNFEETIKPDTAEDCKLALQVAWKDPDFIAEAVKKYRAWLEKKAKK